MSEPQQKPIGMIVNGVWSHYAVATAPKYRDLIELIYVHDLGGARLERSAGLIVPFQNDHEAIASHCDLCLPGARRQDCRIRRLGPLDRCRLGGSPG